MKLLTETPVWESLHINYRDVRGLQLDIHTALLQCVLRSVVAEKERSCTALLNIVVALPC